MVSIGNFQMLSSMKAISIMLLVVLIYWIAYSFFPEINWSSIPHSCTVIITSIQFVLSSSHLFSIVMVIASSFSKCCFSYRSPIFNYFHLDFIIVCSIGIQILSNYLYFILSYSFSPNSRPGSHHLFTMSRISARNWIFQGLHLLHCFFWHFLCKFSKPYSVFICAVCFLLFLNCFLQSIQIFCLKISLVVSSSIIIPF